MPRGIVVGFDENYEWAVKWWHDNYSKHNNYPVSFANFGMSSDIKEWCAKIGIVFDVPNKLRGWFNKPLAILHAPFDHVIWFDLDCEIRGSIEPIFEYSEEGFAVTTDKVEKKRPPLASGVVGVKKPNKILDNWVDYTNKNYKKYRGDQEILEKVTTPNEVIVMPRIYQWLRVDGDTNKDTVVMHWTGNAGNNYIRKQLGLPLVGRRSKRSISHSSRKPPQKIKSKSIKSAIKPKKHHFNLRKKRRGL